MKHGRTTRRARTPAPRTPTRAVNPLQIDTAHKIVCALIYCNVVEIPEGANDDVHYGRDLLMEALIYALETLRGSNDEHVQ